MHFVCILEHFEALWSILEIFWSILEHSGRSLEYFGHILKAIWSILNAFVIILQVGSRILKKEVVPTCGAGAEGASTTSWRFLAPTGFTVMLCYACGGCT